MPRLKIYTYPDTILTQKARPVTRVEGRHRELAQDMLETMYDAPGIGLAANQIGVLERIIVVDTDFDCDDFARERSRADGRRRAFQRTQRVTVLRFTRELILAR